MGMAASELGGIGSGVEGQDRREELRSCSGTHQRSDTYNEHPMIERDLDPLRVGICLSASVSTWQGSMIQTMGPYTADVLSGILTYTSHTKSKRVAHNSTRTYAGKKKVSPNSAIRGPREA